MSFCINCGQKLDEKAKFCAECGKAVTDSNSIEQRKTIYDGEVHKCPHCNEVLNAFANTCPSCGYEIRGIKVSNALQEFYIKLETLERSSPSIKPSLKSLRENQVLVNEADQQKISLIRSFIIPNNKEDILEFLILAASNINERRNSIWEPLTESEKAVSDAWKAKFEQAYEKAKLLFNNTQELQNVEYFYKEKNKQIKDKKIKSILSYIALFVGVFAGIFIMFGIMKLMLN